MLDRRQFLSSSVAAALATSPLARAAAPKRAFPEQSYAKAIVIDGRAAPGEAADVFNLIPDYNDARRFFTLANDLSERGWTAKRIEKILGANFARLFGEVWG